MSFYKTKTALIATATLSVGYYLGRYKSQESPTQSLKDINASDSSPLQGYQIPSNSLPSQAQSIFNNFITVNAKSNLPVVAKSSNIGQIAKYGTPTSDSLRAYEDFVLSYDRRTRTPNWVLEHLTPEKIVKVEGVERTKMKFKEDESFNALHRSTNKDYAGSGYDRGHMAAAANHRQSESAMNQTFILSNVAPQVGEGFNRDAWNDLEKYVRGIAKNNVNTFVCTGPLFLPRKESDGKLYVKYEVIGQNHVAVPTHFFKIVVIETKKGQMELLSYVMPNQPLPNTKVNNWLMPLETIERASGLAFFQNLPKGTFKRVNAISS